MTIFMKSVDNKPFGCSEVVVTWYYAGTVYIAIFLNMEHYKHFNTICNYNHFRILPGHELAILSNDVLIICPSPLLQPLALAL